MTLGHNAKCRYAPPAPASPPSRLLQSHFSSGTGPGRGKRPCRPRQDWWDQPGQLWGGHAAEHSLTVVREGDDPPLQTRQYCRQLAPNCLGQMVVLQYSCIINKDLKGLSWGWAHEAKRRLLQNHSKWMPQAPKRSDLPVTTDVPVPHYHGLTPRDPVPATIDLLTYPLCRCLLSTAPCNAATAHWALAERCGSPSAPMPRWGSKRA